MDQLGYDPQESNERKKTVLRTIRIRRYLDELLERDAAEKGVSVNTLINMILTKYIEFDNWMSRIGYVVLSREGFRRILEATDEKRLLKAMQDSPLRIVDVLTLRFSRADFESYLNWTLLNSKYSKIFQSKYESDDRSFTLTLHHQLGEKWSKLLAQGYKGLFDGNPEIRISPNQVVIRARLPRNIRQDLSS